MSSDVTYAWRDPIADDELIALVKTLGGRSAVDWWEKVSPHSLGWVSARSGDGQLVGFVNVAWDGADHAFILDTTTRDDWQHRGVGTELVLRAARHAQAAGCEWLHVDFARDLGSFYFEACGFSPTDAGLINLFTLEEPPRSDLR